MRREPFLALCAAIAAAIFTLLAVFVPRGVFLDIDTRIMFMARALHGDAQDRLVTMVTDLGWAPIVILLVALVAAWSWLARDRRGALALIAVALADVSVNHALKQGFQRARPELWPRAQLESFAFPSGHSMTSVAIYGMLAVVLTRRVPETRPWALALAPLVAVGIGLSRIYLGVHWPSDVLGGWMAGVVLLIIGVLGLVGWRR